MTHPGTKRGLPIFGHVPGGGVLPIGTFPVGVAAATGHMAVPEVLEIPGNFCMFSDAPLGPSNPHCPELKQICCVCLSQLDHCCLHSTEASEEPAGPVAGQSAECQAQGHTGTISWTVLSRRLRRPCISPPRRLQLLVT